MLVRYAANIQQVVIGWFYISAAQSVQMQFFGCLKDILALWEKYLNINFQKVPIERLFSVRYLKDDLHLEQIDLFLKSPLCLFCILRPQSRKPYTWYIYTSGYVTYNWRCIIRKSLGEALLDPVHKCITQLISVAF